MIVFNFLLISKIVNRKNTKQKAKYTTSGQEKKTSTESGKKKNLTISLLFITFLFLAMTLPSAIAFGFFYESFAQNKNFYMILDNFSFINRASLFLNAFISFKKFRQIVLELFRIKCRKLSIAKNHTQTLFKTTN